MPETIKKVPMRKCIACMTSYPQSQLIRITLQGNELQIDQEKKADGRGCYICKNEKCIETAVKKNAFSRAFKTFIAKDEIEKIRRYSDAK